MAAAQPKWQPVTAEERQATVPKLDPEAPAEVLFQHTDLDESGFPSSIRRRDYLRIKVFKPEQIEHIARISGREISGAGVNDVEFSVVARLTSPDGTVREFGKDAIRERTISEKGERNLLDRLLGAGQARVKERFLAISGVEAGSILEYQTERRQERRRTADVMSGYLLQRSRLPIHSLRMTLRLPSTDDWGYNCFVMNSKVATTNLKMDEKAHTILATATNIPALADEPLAGPTPFYHGLSLFICYQRTRVVFNPWNAGRSFRANPTEMGPWSVVVIRDYALIDDKARPTKRVRQLATELTAGETDPLEKARRIHERVTGLHEKWSQTRRQKQGRLEAPINSLDDILEFDRKTKVGQAIPHDFASLAVALYRASGFEAQTILLPDRRRVLFNRAFVSRAFMPHLAVAVKIGETWHVSIPTLRPRLPFGKLPFYTEGEIGLWLKEGKEEFHRIPASAGGDSLTGNGGNFTLQEDGTLVGTGRRRYTGHAAYMIRQKVLDKTEEQQKNILSQQLSSDLRTELNSGEEDVAEEESDAESEEEEKAAKSVSAAEGLTVTKIAGVDDPAQPLDIDYTLRIPNYAVAAGDRLIVRPWLFRTKSANPLTGETRRTHICFPYAWQELDVVNLTLPTGFAPEMSQIAVPGSSEALFFNATLQYDKERNQIRGRREFASNLMRVDPVGFTALKGWYELLTQFDLQEIVLTRTAAPTVVSQK